MSINADDELLEYWFGDVSDSENLAARGKLWFYSSPEQDNELRERFASLHQQAESGALDAWRENPRSSLALVILLDQLTRNLYRGTSDAFRNDSTALEVSHAGIAQDFDRELHVVERSFYYLPFEHSEQAQHQRRSLELFGDLREHCPLGYEDFTENCYSYARQHYDIIDRFGRYPHRNRVLGRENTEEEAGFLERDGAGFGQG